MRERPRVPVLMPVRNAAPWITEALLSLCLQSERDWELVAVDDESVDGSRGILARWARTDARIRVCSSTTERSGIVSALNLALGEARAPIVVRMDADDLAHRDRLAVQARALESDPTLFAVTCRVRAFPANNVGAGMRRYLAWQNSAFSSEAIRRERFVECPVLHPAVAMRRRDLLALGGWRDCEWPEDWDLFLRAFELGQRVARVADVLVFWRIHAGQTWRCDPRYASRAFMAARAHFLSRALASCRRPVWVLGAGPTGKSLARGLASEGLRIAAFAEIDTRKIGGRVDAVGGRWPVFSMDELLRSVPRPFALAAVSQPGRVSAFAASLRPGAGAKNATFWLPHRGAIFRFHGVRVGTARLGTVASDCARA